MDLSASPWTRIAGAAQARPWVLLPLGAIEAHGPHLPLDADTRMAALLAQRVAEALAHEVAREVMIAPPVTATAASFAAAFPGTVSVAPDAERRVIVDTVGSLLRAGAQRVVLINLHFDPEHMRAVREAVAELDKEHPGRTVFPNFTRRAHAQRIGGEFATGACHGGEFETSLMLVAAPELVQPSFRALPPREVDLAQAIRDGKRSFHECGLDEAYCGRPAAASREEGERLLEVLVGIVLTECRASAAFSSK